MRYVSCVIVNGPSSLALGLRLCQSERLSCPELCLSSECPFTSGRTSLYACKAEAV